MTVAVSDCETQKRDSASVIQLPFNCYYLDYPLLRLPTLVTFARYRPIALST
jgi:hypothetical protein